MTASASASTTMTIEPEPIPPPPVATLAPARRGRKPFPWFGSVISSLILGLAVFNGWWFWRDAQPLENLSTVANWLRAQKYEEADSALRERLRRTPNDADARILRARLLAARGDLLGCARELHEVPSWSPKKPESLYREGSVFLMLDRAREAENAWKEVIKDDPLHPVSPDIFHDAVFEILKLYATEDRWEDAHAVIWRAYDEASPEDQGILLIWRMRSELERVARAESIILLRKYVAADPEDYEALRALARAEQWLGLRDEAERHFQEGLKRHPGDPRLWVDVLTMLHEQGDSDAKLALLARVPKSAESESEIWKFRGLVRESDGDLARAAEDYRQAIERNPFILEYHYKLSIVEEQLGHAKQAAFHRAQSQSLRKARSDLPGAYSDYLKIRNEKSAIKADLVPPMLRLASICRALGFIRAAEAWEQIANAA